MRQLLLHGGPSLSLPKVCACLTAPNCERRSESKSCVSFHIKKPTPRRALVSSRANHLVMQSGTVFRGSQVEIDEWQDKEASKSSRVCQSAIQTYQQAPLSSIDRTLFLSFGGDLCGTSHASKLGKLGSKEGSKVETATPTGFRSKATKARNGCVKFQGCSRNFNPDESKLVVLLDQGQTTQCCGKVNEVQDNVAFTGNHVLSTSQQGSAAYYVSKVWTECGIHLRYRLHSTRNLRFNLVNTSLPKGRKASTAFAFSKVSSTRGGLDWRVSAFENYVDYSSRVVGGSLKKETVKSWNLKKFRVNARGGKPRRSWWQRFLFEKIDSNTLSDVDTDTRDDYGTTDRNRSKRDDYGTTDQNNNGAFTSRDFVNASDTGDSVADNSEEGYADEIDRMLEDDDMFRAWKQRTDAVSELREYQESGRDPDNKDWEDWLDDSWGDYSSYVGGKDSGWYFSQSDWEKDGLPRSPPKMPERGMNRTIKEMLLRIFERQEEVEEDLLFEERVFRFTSQSTAKFVAVLVFLPWLVDFLAHDYVIVPFLNRYVETVPLAAQVLDLREPQKLKMIETLKLERQRVRFEAAIGKAPPLLDDELLEHIRHKALELREELRLENRKEFGNIWSDLLAGVTVLLLLVLNPKQVAIMRLTGNRLFTNISDTGKAFIIILLTDIFLGYHSESGWETVIEMFLDHYGFVVDQASIYVFVAIVPVTIDACFKLWVFRYLTRLSPSAAATFREMQRH